MKNKTNIPQIIKIVFLFFIILTVGKVSLAQNYTSNNEIFGLSYNYETSNLLKDRMFVTGSYTIGRRSFEVGISTNSYTPNSQGLLFQHKIFLNKKQNEYTDFNLKQYDFRTYAMYKFVMFGSPANSLRKNYDVVESKRVTQNSLASPSINTIEHYLGFGAEFKLNDNLSIEAMGVGGINIIKNNSKVLLIEDKILSKSDMYLSWNITVGMNYKF